MKETVFRNRRIKTTDMLAFGFAEKDGLYEYVVDIAENEMTLTVTVLPAGDVFAQIRDKISGEEYVMHRIAAASGSFVGKIREEYESILKKIEEKCFEKDVFNSDEARLITEYARRKYGDELEFLWKKFPDNAILRRKDTKKWYAALLTVQKRKLGIDSDGKTEILDLRGMTEDIETLTDNRKYFPGYHMNKKHWYTICLDGSVPMEEIFERIDASYMLAVK